MPKILQKKCKYQGRIFRIEELKIKFGKRIVYWEIVDTKDPGGVVVVPVDKNKNVYFVRQYRAAWRRKILNLPGGVVEQGKSVKAVVQEELEEEIGLRAKKITFLARTRLLPGYITGFSDLYLAQGLTPSVKKGDEVERLEVINMPWKKAIAMIKDGKIFETRTIAALLFVDRFYKF